MNELEIMKSWKTEFQIILSLLVMWTNLSLCLAHDNVTMHPLISDSAARSSTGLPNFLAECFGYSDLGQTNLSFNDPKAKQNSQSPIEWIKDGSRCEDVPFIRGNNHFYDPTKKPAIGLTDGVNLGGQPSFIWATVETNAIWWQHSYTWLKARDFELNALTNSCKSGRETNLAAMLFYLGHVIHLNQDLTVPAHVRNDNHGVNAQNGPFAALVMWTEKFGKETYSKETNSGFPIEQRGWSWWQNTAGFQRLEDFWDRDLLRTLRADALNADASDHDRTPLGLAEFCNGNFISENATYGDFFTDQSAKHWFQFPRLADTAAPKLKRLRWGGAEIELDMINLPNQVSGYHGYLWKTNSGIGVTHHSALNYEAIKNPRKVGNPQMHVMLTLNDSNVLQEYHSILIPKAVEYSAGLLDYFFRGTMEVTASWGDTNSPYFTNTVLNTSGQDFHGGSFFLFEDATSGTRTLVLQTNLADIITNPNGIFTNGTSLDILCPGPVPPTNKFLLVYQGTIGWANDAALDLVDANIGIAAARVWIKQTMTYTYLISVPYPGATITTNLESDDFDFTPTPSNFEVFINHAYMDDDGSVGGVAAPSSGDDCGWPHTPIISKIIPATNVTIVGNHLQVNITATDNGCGRSIGWMDVSIAWRAWPSP